MVNVHSDYKTCLCTLFHSHRVAVTMYIHYCYGDLPPTVTTPFEASLQHHQCILVHLFTCCLRVGMPVRKSLRAVMFFHNVDTYRGTTTPGVMYQNTNIFNQTTVETIHIQSTQHLYATNITCALVFSNLR
jgi:hypothetical protein